MFRKSDALSRLRTKSFLAVCLVGGLSGVVTGLHGKGTMGVFLYGFSGAVSVIIMASAGGFLGMFLRNAVFSLRGGKAEEGHINTDGLFPASSFGALVGLIAVLVAADWGGAYYGAVIGAFFGGVLGVLPGEAVGVLLRMLAFEERSKDKEERAAEQSGEEVPGLRELQQSEEQAEGRAEEEPGEGPVEETGGPEEDVSDEDEDLREPEEDVSEDKE